MSKKADTLEIKEVIRETPESVTIVFALSEEKKEAFAYKPGQYLTLESTIDSVPVRRSYSLSSSPFIDTDAFVCIKQIKNGLYSTYANTHLQKGDTVSVFPAEGKFCVDISEKNEKNYILFAAGSGITPIISIVKSVLVKEKNSSVTLFYSNKTEKTSIYLEKLRDMANKYEKFSLFEIYTQSKKKPFSSLLRKDLFTGRIRKKKIEKYLSEYTKNGNNEYYICGPEGFVETVKDGLKTSGVAEETIKVELFFTEKSTQKEANTEEKKTVTVIFEGNTHIISLKGNQSILSACLSQGLEVPFSCKGGVCSSCIAKLKAGETTHDDVFGITEGELKEGWRLCCSSRPVGNDVIVSFDE